MNNLGLLTLQTIHMFHKPDPVTVPIAPSIGMHCKMAPLLAQNVNQTDVCSVCQSCFIVTLQLQLLPPKLVLSFSLMERDMVGHALNHGIGIIVIVVLCYSEGEYVETSPGQIERNGMGTHQSANGMTYTGQWVGDKMNGKGLL